MSTFVPKLKDIVNVKIPASFNSIHQVDHVEVLRKFKYSGGHSEDSFRTDDFNTQSLLAFHADGSSMSLL